MKKNEIYLHYEEFGDLDYKVKVTTNIIASYLASIYRIAIAKCYAILNEKLKQNPNYITDLYDDERFYKFLKKHFAKQAENSMYHEESFAVAALVKGELLVKVYANRENADYYFGALKRNRPGSEVILMRRRFNYPYQSTPIRRTQHYSNVLLMFQKKQQEEMRRSISANEIEMLECRKKRQNHSCKECIRYQVYGVKGCPTFTRIVDEGGNK